jgi:hypothetical protein
VLSRNLFVVVCALAIAPPLLAQPHVTPPPGGISNEVRLQVFSFDNFFYSPDPGGKKQVNALGAEYRAAWRFGPSPAELFAHAGVLRYDQSNLRTAYGGRLGVRSETEAEEYKVYIDSAHNRPVSDLRNAGTANRTTLYGEYGHRVAKVWELATDATYERQHIRDQPTRDNTLTAIEGLVRYRGFGWQVVPHAGVVAGRRRVHDNRESYRDRGLFAGVEVIPLAKLYLSLDYRSVRRGFDTAVLHGDHEHHGIIELVGDWHVAPRLHGTLYYSREQVGSPLPGQSLHAQIVLVGAAWTF